jgi:hypothetical protein
MTPAIFLIAIGASMPTTNLDSVCQNAKIAALLGEDQANALDSVSKTKRRHATILDMNGDMLRPWRARLAWSPRGSHSATSN